jgi:hypothetical protein
MGTRKQGWLNWARQRAARTVLKLTGNSKHATITKKRRIARKTDYASLFEGESFLAAAQEVLDQGRTLMSLQRLHVLWQAIGNSRHVPGDLVEVGVFRGGSSYFLARACTLLGVPPVALHAIDTFEGHATGTISAEDSFHTVGMFAETSFDQVREYLARFPFVKVHQGEFSAVAPSLTSRAYRLVHIDTDLYQPTLDCLDYFLPRLSPGGIFVVDDYLGRKCPGVTAAVHEFLQQQPAFNAWFCQTEQIVLTHRDFPFQMLPRSC